MRITLACGADSTSTSSDGNTSASRASGSLHGADSNSGAIARVSRRSNPWCKASACACSWRRRPAIWRASGSSARATSVGRTSRLLRSNSCRSSPASSWAIVMLTADGTRPSARAAAEKEPWSSTARKTSTLSLFKAMPAMLSEILIAVDFCCQTKPHSIPAMQGIKRKLVYVSLYELIAVGMTSAGLALMGGHSLEHASVAAIASSAIALVWNLVYNQLFEAWEARQTRRGRSFARRVAHALGFERGLVLMLVPLFAWWLQVSLWQALLLDLGLILFFLVYTFVFSWVFDRVFGLPASAQPA